MSNLKFVPIAIIAILSATVSQARAEESLGSGSARIYPYLAGNPDRDAYTGQLTPAAKLGLTTHGAATVGSAQLQPLNADNSVAAAGKHRRHSQALDAFAQAPASARSGSPAVSYDAAPPSYDDQSKFGGQPR